MIQPEMHSAIQSYYDSLGTQPQDAAFMCLYGSSVYEENNTTSDVDLFLVSDRMQHHLPRHLNAMVSFVRKIHLEHNRELDEEVPHDNKLVYSTGDINKATSLTCFDSDESGQISVPRVEKSAAFLSGPGIKLRLALNALTTPHVIVCDRPSSYKIHRSAAEVAMTIAGISLCGAARFTQENIFEQLAESVDGQKEEFHLGYKTRSPEVTEQMQSFIEESLHRLQKEDIITRARGAYASIGDFRAQEIAASFTLRGSIEL